MNPVAIATAASVITRCWRSWTMRRDEIAKLVAALGDLRRVIRDARTSTPEPERNPESLREHLYFMSATRATRYL
jgi:hypothetical protein